MPKPNRNLKKVCLFMDVNAIKKAQTLATKNGMSLDIAGHTSTLLRYLVEDFTRKSGK